MFVGDVTGDRHTLSFSDLLDGDDFSSGSSGTLDLFTVFPEGFDSIVAIREFNNFLVIFCERNILLYTGASSPSSMSLSDIISGIGCISRDSVQSIGTDIFFLSTSGIRSLGRVIQEKSNPIGNVSKNVRDSMMQSVNAEALNIKSVYSPENSFYLLFLPTSNEVFCFDTRGVLEDGASRATLWKNITILGGARLDDGTLLFGNSNGLNKYDGFLDGTQTYSFKYFFISYFSSFPTRFEKFQSLPSRIIIFKI